MFNKELYTSVVAYNLVVQFRRQSAKIACVKSRRLSFQGVRTTLKDRLLLQPACSFEERLDRYAEALHRASQKKHPNRKNPRSYPRKAHPRRQKSTKSEKAQRKKKPKDKPPLQWSQSKWHCASARRLMNIQVNHLVGHIEERQP